MKTKLRIGATIFLLTVFAAAWSFDAPIAYAQELQSSAPTLRHFVGYTTSEAAKMIGDQESHSGIFAQDSRPSISAIDYKRKNQGHRIILKVFGFDNLNDVELYFFLVVNDGNRFAIGDVSTDDPTQAEMPINSAAVDGNRIVIDQSLYPGVYLIGVKNKKTGLVSMYPFYYHVRRDVSEAEVHPIN